MMADLSVRLRTDSAISDIVSNRVHWVRRPQKGEFPAITLQGISDGRSYTYKGGTDLQGDTVRIDIWALRIEHLDTIRSAVIATLEQANETGTTKFGMSFLQSGRDAPPEDVPGIGSVVRKSLDFLVWWEPLI